MKYVSNDSLRGPSLAMFSKLVSGKGDDDKVVALGAGGHLWKMDASQLKGAAGKSVNQQVRHALCDALIGSGIQNDVFNRILDKLGFKQSNDVFFAGSDDGSKLTETSSAGKPLLVRDIKRILKDAKVSTATPKRSADVGPRDIAALDKVKVDKTVNMGKTGNWDVLSYDMDNDANYQKLVNHTDGEGPNGSEILRDIFHTDDDDGSSQSVPDSLIQFGNSNYLDMEEFVGARVKELVNNIKDLGLCKNGNTISRDTLRAYVKHLASAKDTTFGKWVAGIERTFAEEGTPYETSQAMRRSVNILQIRTTGSLVSMDNKPEEVLAAKLLKEMVDYLKEEVLKCSEKAQKSKMQNEG